MEDDVITLGALTIRRKARESYQSHTAARKISTGDLIPFHVTDEKIDLRIGYAIFVNGERDIRAVEVNREFATFGRLVHGLRLSVLPVSGSKGEYFVELKQAIPKHAFEKHETLHPTRSEIDLDGGAGLSVFAELRKLGAEVGTKQELLAYTKKTSLNLCARFPKENLWVPVAAYAMTRILPIYFGYRGYPKI